MHQQTHQLSMCQRKMTRVSMEPTRHASTDLPPVNVSKKDDESQHGAHQAMHQQTYRLSTCQRKMTRVSMEPTRHASTDSPTVNVSRER